MLFRSYLTAAVLNYIALCGWSPKGEQEIFSLEEMEKIWSESGISKSQDDEVRFLDRVQCHDLTGSRYFLPYPDSGGRVAAGEVVA